MNITIDSLIANVAGKLGSLPVTATAEECQAAAQAIVEEVAGYVLEWQEGPARSDKDGLFVQDAVLFRDQLVFVNTVPLH